MNNEETNIEPTYIPNNIINQKKIWIVLVEIALYLLIVLGTIFLIPFVLKVKIIIMAVLGVSGSFFIVAGIKNRTISEIIMIFIKFQRKKRSLHLRSIKYGRAESKLKNKEFDGMSYAEKFIEIGKEKIKELAERG